MPLVLSTMIQPHLSEFLALGFQIPSRESKNKKKHCVALPRSGGFHINLVSCKGDLTWFPFKSFLTCVQSLLFSACGFFALRCSFSFQERKRMFVIFREKEGKATVSVAVSTDGGALSLTDGWHGQPLRTAKTLATCDVCGKQLARQSDLPRHKRLHDPKPDRW
jgi:hypothetical protein